MLRYSSRSFPRIWNLFGRGNALTPKAFGPQFKFRTFYNRRNDPFSQMETFMRDMEKKFWNEMNTNFGRIPFLSRFGLPNESSSLPTSSYYPQNIGLGGPSDLSTADKFKLRFDLPQAKPDDINVTLKDRLLTVEGKIEEISESTSLKQSFSYQYTLPPNVNLDSLQSLFENEGVLIVEASKTPDEAPKTINIKRE